MRAGKASWAVFVRFADSRDAVIDVRHEVQRGHRLLHELVLPSSLRLPSNSARERHNVELSRIILGLSVFHGACTEGAYG